MRSSRHPVCALGSIRTGAVAAALALLAASGSARADDTKKDAPPTPPAAGGGAGAGVGAAGGGAGVSLGGSVSLGGGGVSAGGAANANANASGAAAATPAKTGGAPAAPGGAATVTTYSPDQQKGNAAYAARDFNAAIEAYRQAIAGAPSDPMGHYLLGEAQLAAGNLAEAEASWSAGLRFVKDKDSLHAKLLFVLADLRERQGKWTEAKQAWNDYAQFVGSHPDAHGYAATATERQARIVAHEELDAKYAPVRQRIADRQKELEKPAPDDSPQRGTKPGKAPSAPKKK